MPETDGVEEVLAFAAEESRHTKTLINMDEYRQRVEREARDFAF